MQPGANPAPGPPAKLRDFSKYDGVKNFKCLRPDTFAQQDSSANTNVPRSKCVRMGGFSRHKATTPSTERKSTDVKKRRKCPPKMFINFILPRVQRAKTTFSARKQVANCSKTPQTTFRTAGGHGSAGRDSETFRPKNDENTQLDTFTQFITRLGKLGESTFSNAKRS